MITRMTIPMGNGLAKIVKPNGDVAIVRVAKSAPGDALDALDDGLLEGGSGEGLRLTQPPPVVITNVIPSQKDSISPEEFQEGFSRLASQLKVSNASLADQITQAVIQALRAQPHREPHRGRVKRVVRDVEHDHEGKITRIIDTEKEDE